jgi:hypothetical protein
MVERFSFSEPEQLGIHVPLDFDALQGLAEVVEVGESRIRVCPSPKTRCECKAHCTEGVVYCAVKTIQDDGQRHPFFEQFRAHQLLHAMIEHFEQTQKVTQLAFIWQCPTTEDPGDRSDNFASYIKRKQELRESGLSSKEQRIIATKATWTFKKVAVPLRFWHVLFVSETEENGAIIQVDGRFAR